MTEESRAIMLELLATDPELTSELARFRQGRERSDFAITAKKIGQEDRRAGARAGSGLHRRRTGSP